MNLKDFNRTNNKRLKFLLLTDSIANPRSFPVDSIVHLEQTYPYLMRENYSDAIFWQLSYGNITTEELVNQAISYLTHWEPDFIIIQSGINDCRPEAFTEFQKTLINAFSVFIFKYLRKYIYNPNLIKTRQLHRVTKRKFGKTLKKIKMIFSESKIYYLEICAGQNYESARPGVTQRLVEYNQIVKEVFADDVISVSELLLKKEGFNKDNLHWNVQGHYLVSQALTNKISDHIEKVQGQVQ